MKLKNSTEFPNYFLRRMISWCCPQLDDEMKTRHVREARFGDRRYGTSGYAWCSFRVVLMKVGRFKYENDGVEDGSGTLPVEMPLDERTDDLVSVTAHELFHIYAYMVGCSNTERQARWHEKEVLKAFLADRSQLIEQWSREPKPRQRPQKPKPSLQEKRAATAQQNLMKWQRKLKRAQTKVKKYRERVRYYEKQAAYSS